MIQKQYDDLVKREEQLMADMKLFIYNVLKANNNHISCISILNDDEDASLEDKYPVISTLWGKHDNYNIAITDVYLKEYDKDIFEIYADGIDQDTETMKKEFKIHSLQFSDIMYFIMACLKETL